MFSRILAVERSPVMSSKTASRRESKHAKAHLHLHFHLDQVCNWETFLSCVPLVHFASYRRDILKCRKWIRLDETELKGARLEARLELFQGHLVPRWVFSIHCSVSQNCFYPTTSFAPGGCLQICFWRALLTQAELLMEMYLQKIPSICFEWQ